MKESIRISKKVYFFTIILTFLIFGTSIVFGNVSENELTFDINQFKENVQSSPDECWKNPAENRKNTICNKLTELQQLIIEENFEEAYNKLLHDIKPKLTGLKQNEHGEPWGNGVYKEAWVICDELRVSFEEECNLILSQINPLSGHDDDDTPPTIEIYYDGTYTTAYPGEWIVVIEDPESGLDDVQILVDGVEVIHETNLNGITLKLYYPNVPGIEGTHTIDVTAINNDKDYVGDQESHTETGEVTIVFIPPIPPA